MVLQPIKNSYCFFVRFMEIARVVFWQNLNFGISKFGIRSNLIRRFSGFPHLLQDNNSKLFFIVLQRPENFVLQF